MAARQSTSIGIGATITILAVATLGLFITSMVFYAQRREALTAREQLEKTSKEIITDAERNDPVFAKVREAAQPGRPTGKPVVRYLLDERKELMQKVTGSDRDTIDTVNKALEASKATSLLSALHDRQTEIDSLTRQLKDSDEARTRALQDKKTESERVKGIEDSYKASVASLQDEVNKTKAESDALREGIDTFKKQMDKRVEDIRADYAAKEAALKGDIDKLQSQQAIDKVRIKQFEDQNRGTRFQGQSEYALIDGQVVGTTPTDNTLTINIGRRQHVVLGLPFTVYSQGTTIRLDEKTGDYPPGKATVEVIRVDPDTSVARVIREQKGNPIVRGDVIANPIYDPAKKYKFLVYGNFDPSGTGTPSVFGANEIKAWIKDWGGETVDDLTGDVDFIVLGERPQLPPQPGPSAAIESINFYLNAQKAARRYDELLKQATDTSIPVLNENRLRTLLGR
ncbi:MAG TPA: FlgT C-terminal domain-containing protein [Phycisphaerales bacterium]|jgi:hypothetical protein|nr:FlgT C-terminal domain-containing protein [Phycisphaerales bacterium]